MKLTVFIARYYYLPLRIQLRLTKVENVSLKRRYDELSQANTHSRTANTEKLSALTAENTKLKAQVTGKTSSGPSTSETPKVLAPGMYNLGSKYIPPPKRANWVKPTPLPLIEARVKPTSGASKTVPKRAPRNHSSLPVKSANARSVEAHHRTLNKKNRVDSNLLVKHSVSVSKLNNVCAACNKSLVFANHNDCLVMCDDSVNVKPHQTKRRKHQPKKEWKPIKRVWKPISKPVASSKPQWKPTGRHFSLFEKNPLTRIMEPTDMPIELPPSLGKSKKASHPLKAENTNTEVLHTLHMDLCGPMRTESINGKKYVLVIVDDYTRFWIGKKPNLQYFRVFGSLCYPTNDYDDVGKLKAKADIGIFVGYAPTKKAYRIYNKRNAYIQKRSSCASMELTEGLTSVQTSSGLAPQQMTSVPNSTELELTALHPGTQPFALEQDP
ncbi:retrovirus-related pol polyprotein from transposon TNT 1-94 [Tanacetum coccineum]